jgi:hypothetical protein
MALRLQYPLPTPLLFPQAAPKDSRVPAPPLARTGVGPNVKQSQTPLTVGARRRCQAQDLVAEALDALRAAEAVGAAVGAGAAAAAGGLPGLAAVALGVG